MPSCLSRGSVTSLWQKDKARKWGNWQGDRCTRNRRSTWKEVKRQMGWPCVWKVLWCQTRCQAVVSEVFGINNSNVGKFRLMTLPWEWISKVAWRWRLIKMRWSRNWEAGNIHRDINSPLEECVVWVEQAVSHMHIFKEMGKVGGCRRDVDL